MNKVFPQLKQLLNDYQDKFNRGTVEYTPKFRNYAFHKVVFKNGEVIEDKNFSQKLPGTQAITGKNLKFIRCNLTNNLIDPSWVIEECNVSQKNLKEKE